MVAFLVSRRRFRDALVAILEDEDGNDEDLELGDESMDEEVDDKQGDQADDMTEFSLQEGEHLGLLRLLRVILWLRSMRRSTRLAIGSERSRRCGNT